MSRDRRPLPIRRRGAALRFLERVVLGFGMTLMALVIERRLIKAIKKGGVEAAPRTAAAGEEPEVSRDGELAPSPPEQVHDEAGGK